MSQVRKASAWVVCWRWSAGGADAQRAGVGLDAQLAELVPVGEVPQELLVFGVRGRREPFGQPALEEKELAVLAGQDAAFHEQIAQVGGGPPVRHLLDSLVGEGDVAGGEVPQQRGDLRVVQPDEAALGPVHPDEQVVQREQARAGAGVGAAMHKANPGLFFDLADSASMYCYHCDREMTELWED
ncbi:hypothetical protein [Streptomyces sp. CBMA156]|uniref:hypothetical protein n=1 Tax=Streptomyces sp. CBMA156 TaxID=1930280 RepID=UPI00166217F6|nr:hypothetical protein [Streptomyces sp. CBMA156]